MSQQHDTPTPPVDRWALTRGTCGHTWSRAETDTCQVCHWRAVALETHAQLLETRGKVARLEDAMVTQALRYTHLVNEAGKAATRPVEPPGLVGRLHRRLSALTRALDHLQALYDGLVDQLAAARAERDTQQARADRLAELTTNTTLPGTTWKVTP